ncbi:MAG: NAD(P)H-binding protein [Chloroflexi bacterium]|nr:NAD(P)H-binding protein [Chloroflexota bacterium]OJV97141.1 MAG: hypothetical protein BGO39_19335 [Chloroflexi bacterium 54-19]
MYALTGASGQLGRLTITNLLTKIPANQIIATTRSPEKLAEFAAQGVIVRPADLNDPATLEPAFDGVTRLLIISTSEFGKQTVQNRAAIEAGLRAGASHLFYTSVPQADSDLSHWLLKEHAETENLLRDSGVAWTALRNNAYTNLLPGILKSLIDRNKLYVLGGDSRPGWISREDCARVAAAALIGGNHPTGPLEVTGPEALGLAGLTGRLSDLLREEITVQVVSGEELVTRLKAKNLPEVAAYSLVRIVDWLVNGNFSGPTDVVERIAGVKPAPVDEFLKEFAGSKDTEAFVPGAGKAS